MTEYAVQISEKALDDMEAIYRYIAEERLSPQTAMKRYDCIASAILKLAIFPERIKLMDTEAEGGMGLRQLVIGHYAAFFVIRENKVIVTRVLYAKSDMVRRLRENG